MYLDNYKSQITGICNKYNVKNLLVFGSVLTDQFNEDSDIDFLVDIDSNDPIDYGEKYFNLKFELEDLLERPIDLLELKAIKNSYLIDHINNSQKMLYEA